MAIKQTRAVPIGEKPKKGKSTIINAENTSNKAVKAQKKTAKTTAEETTENNITEGAK